MPSDGIGTEQRAGVDQPVAATLAADVARVRSDRGFVERAERLLARHHEIIDRLAQ